VKLRLLLLSLATPACAFGQGFGPLRWDYVAAGVIAAELDRIGYEIEGSIAVTPDIIVAGGYRDFDPGERIDRRTAHIGVGYRWNLRPNLDILASISYADNEIDNPAQTVDEEGLVLGGQIRGWLTRRIELSGAVLLDNSLGSSTEVVVEFGGQFHRGRNLSFGARVRAEEGDEVVIGGVRFYFGASRR
jgi:hypothetical protein